MARCLPALVLTILVMSGFTAQPASAIECGTTAAGFDAWKASFQTQAKRNGIGASGLAALAGASYARDTIRADRGQKSFGYTLDKFMQVRGANAIVSQGKKRKAADAKLFAALEARYGIPAGVLVAIWGMETAFGRNMGNSNLVSATATLAYDCRRPDFFTSHLYAALKLIDRGSLSASTRGAKHGEVGQTQFLPGSVLQFGTDGNGDGRIDLTGKADALASTANFLAAHGWIPGKGYQPGEPNFIVIQQWNAASVYQQAIAIIGKRIDG